MVAACDRFEGVAAMQNTAVVYAGNVTHRH